MGGWRGKKKEEEGSGNVPEKMSQLVPAPSWTRAGGLPAGVDGIRLPGAPGKCPWRLSGQLLPPPMEAESQCTCGEITPLSAEGPEAAGAVSGESLSTRGRHGPDRHSCACWGCLDPVPGSRTRGSVTLGPRAVNRNLGMISHSSPPRFSCPLIHKWEQMRTVCFERRLLRCQRRP